MPIPKDEGAGGLDCHFELLDLIVGAHGCREVAVDNVRCCQGPIYPVKVAGRGHAEVGQLAMLGVAKGYEGEHSCITCLTLCMCRTLTKP